MRRANKLFIAIAVLGVGVMAWIGFAQPAAALYSTPFIDQNLRKGVTSAVEWDQCRGNLSRIGNMGTAARADINANCSYTSDTWLSGRGTPKAVLPVDVQAGQVSVPLQINSVKFVAGPLVESDGMPSLASVIDDLSRWVTSAGDANDRHPNARGTSGQKPALVATHTKIVGLSVVAGGGSVSQEAVNDSFTMGRDDNSRYWFGAPKNVTYSKAGGIKDGDSVTLRVSFKQQNAYFKGGSHIETTCARPNGSIYSNFGANATSPDFSAIDGCAVGDQDLSIEFNVPFDYTLVPLIENISNGMVVSQNSRTSVTGRIDNAGPTPSHDTIQYQLSQTIFNPATPMNQINRSAGFTDAATPFCAWSQISNKKSCSVIAAAQNQTYDVGTFRPANVDGDVSATLPIGTKVCYTMSVQRYSENDSSGVNWRHSPMICTIVGKYPTVHVLGNDLRVGRAQFGGTPGTGLVVTGNMTNSAGVFGSWSEYGIVPSGLLKNMASGSGYVGGAPAPAPGNSFDTCSVSLLTFNNYTSPKCSLTTLGQYAPATPAYMPDIQKKFSTATKTPLPASPVNISGLQGVYSATGGVTLQGATISPSRWVVIYAPTSTVSITGDIKYNTSTPLTDAKAIPQVIIIAQNILIQDSVTQIDAWLIANGTGNEGRINTCALGAGVTETSPVNAGVCNKKLTVNGPVAARHLFLRRTFGATTDNNGKFGDAAEVFNLRPDAYLWAMQYISDSGILPTVSTKELPPRF